jgi:large subunit ribosomal protein L28
MNVSHSNRHTKRQWLPNLQKVNILIEGRKRKEYVCVKCLKAGKVVKAV